MTFSSQIAATRFGYGLSPIVPAPQSADAMLDLLRGADLMQDRFAIGTFYDLQSRHTLYDRFRRHARRAGDTPSGKKSYEKQIALGKEMRALHQRWIMQTVARRVHGQDAFRERLVAFWSDHFTAFSSINLIKFGTPVYIEDTIRPNITGRFSDLLIAAVLHPVMLHYLDQEYSIGPNSRYARRRDRTLGLNENLAREVLELHTLGVDGPYAQDDVRSLAKVLTGLSRSRDFSFQYRGQFAEPGAQTVLGVRYDAPPSRARIETVLRDLAAHPATAAHIARKLAVHFVADTPPPALVEALTQTYLETDGALMAMYATLLRHPQSWQTPARNMRPPDEFMCSALRALAVPAEVLQTLSGPKVNRLFLAPMRRMGQIWQRPPGPDGWAEQDSAWLTPQGLAGRLSWAMDVPKRLVSPLPDPRTMVTQALGDAPPAKVVFAASAAESKAEAIGLILMSPAFQRR